MTEHASLIQFLRRLSPRCNECGRWWWSKSGRKFCSFSHSVDRVTGANRG